MAAWFDWYANRFNAELEAFSKRGIAVEIDEAKKAEGQLSLSLSFDHDGRTYDLKAAYPDLYPFFPPEVLAPQESFSRHQHPSSKQLCLIGRRTSAWRSDWMLADVICEQLPKIIEYDKTRNEEQIVQVEEPQGEPVTEYYNGEGLAESCILYDSAWTIPHDLARGSLTLKYELCPSDFAKVGVPRGWIEKVSDASGAPVCDWDGPRPRAEKLRTETIRWVRIDPPPSGNAQDLSATLSDEDRIWLRLNQSPTKKSSPLFAAILFSEEVEQFKYSDAWALIERWHDPKRVGHEQSRGAMVRTFRAGEGDLAARMPSVQPLRNKTIALFGVGALGSIASMELARAGVQKIHLVDGDYVEPATVRRWLGGWPSFARQKVSDVAARITTEYPWTHAQPHNWRVGTPWRDASTTSQLDQLMEIIIASDLIIDFSAELAVNHVLSEFCKLHSKPYVLANATPGAWGGMVAQFIQNQGHACWLCLRRALYEQKKVELPVADPEGDVQPPGCAARTFTGTSVDLQEVVLETVRVSLGILCDDKYPRTQWQIGILNLRTATGERISPSWTQVSIDRRTDCECLGE